MLALRPFQKRFLKSALAEGTDISVLSCPRGNGKSHLAAHVVARSLMPGDPLFRPGTESILCAGSLAQARIVYRAAKGFLEPSGGYRFADSAGAVGIVHAATDTRLRAIASRGRTAFGLVHAPFVIMDEPGSLETRGGELLYEAVSTALGKPDSPMRVMLIGTLAPAAENGWWHRLVGGGSHGSTHVTLLQGRLKDWDSWSNIRRCNPLVEVSATFRKRLLEERDQARADPRLKATFCSFRLNVPSADESQTLLTQDDWRLSCARDLPARSGRPLVGIDLGGSRAWSSAVAIFKSGRVEAIAFAPGLPSLADQEKRDRVPKGTYARLVEAGSLRLATGLHVPPVGLLLDAVREEFGVPDCYIGDRFRLGELQDQAGRVPIVPRVSRWSESSFDIRALRRLMKDGPMVVAPDSRELIVASLAASQVQNDSSGNVRMVKADSNSCGRDDVVAAWILAAGAFERAGVGRPATIYHGSI